MRCPFKESGDLLNRVNTYQSRSPPIGNSSASVERAKKLPPENKQKSRDPVGTRDLSPPLNERLIHRDLARFDFLGFWQSHGDDALVNLCEDLGRIDCRIQFERALI